jgi:acetyltransferase-like isoleucine patch superfamily enzyme
MPELLTQLRIYYGKTKFLSPHALPWNRARVQWAFMRQNSYVMWPLYGHVLDAIREGRFEIGRNVTMMAGCWLTMPGAARLRIGRNVYVNGNVMLHAYESIDIGDFAAIGRGSFITDATHRVDHPRRPIMQAGMELRGPTVIGQNVWIGNNVTITGGVSIGDRAIVGANSVVTTDVEPYTVVGGVPARVIKRLEPVDSQQQTAVPDAST